MFTGQCHEIIWIQSLLTQWLKYKYRGGETQVWLKAPSVVLGHLLRLLGT